MRITIGGILVSYRLINVFWGVLLDCGDYSRIPSPTNRTELKLWPFEQKSCSISITFLSIIYLIIYIYIYIYRNTYIYENPSINFQTFLYRHLKLFYVQYAIAIHLMRWLTNFYDFRFKGTATAEIRIHPTKAWLLQLVNLKNVIWAWGHWRRMICNKICLNHGKKATETYGMLQTAFGASCMNQASVFE